MTDSRDLPLNGFKCLNISSNELRLGIVPELGGKILKLIDRSNGVDWLWSPPELTGLFANRIEDSFAKSTLAGADECFPTVAGCRWRERDLPDHGELWAVPWTVCSLSENEIDLLVRTPISPFVFRRRIVLDGQAAHFFYSVENIGKNDEQFLWAFHPLLNYSPGDSLEIPARSARIDSQLNTPFGSRGASIAWPEPQPGVKLDQIDFGSLGPAIIKFFTDSLDRGRVALVRPSLARRLVFEFDLSEINTVGVSINTGGWAGYHHVALEPTNGAPDPLDIAANWNRTGRVGAGATVKWSMTLRLEKLPGKIP